MNDTQQRLQALAGKGVDAGGHCRRAGLRAYRCNSPRRLGVSHQSPHALDISHTFVLLSTQSALGTDPNRSDPSFFFCAPSLPFVRKDATMQRSRGAGTLVPLSSFATNTPHHPSLPVRHLPHRLSLSGPKLAPKRNAANETPPRYGMRETNISRPSQWPPPKLARSWPGTNPGASICSWSAIEIQSICYRFSIGSRF